MSWKIEYVQGACTICANKHTEAVNLKYKELDNLQHFDKIDNPLWKQYVKEYNEAYDKEKELLAKQKDWCAKFHGREKTEVQVCGKCLKNVVDILGVFDAS